MPGDPKECRAHAAHCRDLAAQTTNPSAKEALTNLAQHWSVWHPSWTVPKPSCSPWPQQSPRGIGQVVGAPIVITTVKRWARGAPRRNHYL
jgi:hypothetical protein